MLDEGEVVTHVRAALSGVGSIREVKMFGGIGFMLNGNMVVAASKRGLLARVGKERRNEALAWAGARPMVMGGRTMDGYVYIDRPALTAGAIGAAIELAVSFVQTLPHKTAGAKQAPRKKTRK